MPVIDFSQIYYYPALLCGIGEHLGYRHLSDQDKSNLVPILELSQRGNAPDLEQAISEIQETAGARPFVLDLCKEPAPPPYIAANPQNPTQDRIRVERERLAQQSYNQTLASLLRPDDGFLNWRNLIQRFPNCVPTIQHTGGTNQSRQILRQAALLAEGGRSLAIRITAETDPAILKIIPQIISILVSPDRLLIVIDCGQGRTSIPARSAFARNAIAEILANIEITEQPFVRAVCLSNAYTQPAHDGLREDYDILDWRLWREVREAFPFMFGDYASMYRMRRQNTFVPPDWRPTVVFPLNERWVVYRHPNANDATGWHDGSVMISKLPYYQPTPDAWGISVIERAARNDLTEISTARFWYAAKVNIHIHRQIAFARSTIETYGGEE